MSGMSCTRWNAVAEKMQHTFGRQALPIVWDFAEVVVTADAPGNWKSGPPTRSATVRSATLVAALAFATACAPGQAKRWFSPGHNKEATSSR